MGFHLIDDLQEEYLITASEKEQKTVDEILHKAIDEYYMNHYSDDRGIKDTLEEIREMNEKQLQYLRSIAIQTHSRENYESIMNINEEINHFFNN